MTLICEAACIVLAIVGTMQDLQPPPIEDMPLLLSWYDPELCNPENGGYLINCDSDPSVMAGGTAVTAEGKTQRALIWQEKGPAG